MRAFLAAVSFVSMSLLSSSLLADDKVDSTLSFTLLASNYAQDCFNAAEYGTGNPESCNRALLEPMSTRDRAATFGNRAVLRIRQGDFDAALADCEQGLSVDATVGEVYLDRGAARLGLMQHTDAIKDFDKAIELGVRKVHLAYFDRALAKEDLGDIKGAYADYQKAAQADPTFKLATDQLKRFKVSPANKAS